MSSRYPSRYILRYASSGSYRTGEFVGSVDKTRETRLRRAADRQGLRLERSRRRDPRAVDYGRYWLLDLATGDVVAGASRIGRPAWDLDQVEAYLTGTPPEEVPNR
jgi:hypothetical protein